MTSTGRMVATMATTLDTNSLVDLPITEQTVRGLLQQIATLRGMLGGVDSEACAYCCLADKSQCKVGFPGCPWAGDILINKGLISEAQELVMLTAYKKLGQCGELLKEALPPGVTCENGFGFLDGVPCKVREKLSHLFEVFAAMRQLDSLVADVDGWLKKGKSLQDFASDIYNVVAFFRSRVSLSREALAALAPPDSK